MKECFSEDDMYIFLIYIKKKLIILKFNNYFINYIILSEMLKVIESIWFIIEFNLILMKIYIFIECMSMFDK